MSPSSGHRARGMDQGTGSARGPQATTSTLAPEVHSAGSGHLGRRNARYHHVKQDERRRMHGKARNDFFRLIEVGPRRDATGDTHRPRDKN